MRRVISLMLALTVLLCTNVFADLQTSNDTINTMTVKQIKRLPKDTDIIVKGHIKKIRSKVYELKDSSGKIQVIISNNELQGITIIPGIEVTIYGRVDLYMRSGMGKSVSIVADKVKIDNTPLLK